MVAVSPELERAALLRAIAARAGEDGWADAQEVHADLYALGWKLTDINAALHFHVAHRGPRCYNVYMKGRGETPPHGSRDAGPQP